ncbi:MAG: HPF/RaiA family ribosome-associated protein [Candidatus Kapabacteria bacterium]|jgi:ribosomal subunit interface protein|nr:HPF/RaiA family ribosome-associated protein [Candidatus Kapabacteria bacterium]
MDVHVTARHCKLSSEEHDAAVLAAQQFSRYHDGIIRVDGIFENGVDKTCEYTVRLQGHTIVARENSESFGKSIHEAAHKIVRQLRKLKTKLHHTRETVRV